MCVLPRMTAQGKPQCSRGKALREARRAARALGKVRCTSTPEPGKGAPPPPQGRQDTVAGPFRDPGDRREKDFTSISYLSLMKYKVRHWLKANKGKGYRGFEEKECQRGDWGVAQR